MVFIIFLTHADVETAVARCPAVHDETVAKLLHPCIVGAVAALGHLLHVFKVEIADGIDASNAYAHGVGAAPFSVLRCDGISHFLTVREVARRVEGLSVISLYGGAFGQSKLWHKGGDVGFGQHLKSDATLARQHIYQRVVLAEKHCFGVVYMDVCLLNVTLSVERLVLETRCERCR